MYFSFPAFMASSAFKRSLFILSLCIISFLQSYADVVIGDFQYSMDEATKSATLTKFKGSVNTENVTIPSEITYNETQYIVNVIGVDAFERCTSLQTITIPNSVNTICTEAFEDCSSLTSITFEDGENPIYLDGLAMWHCPVSFMHIGRYLILMEGLILEKGSITGLFAFSDKDFTLSEVTLGENLRYIGESLFKGCKALTTFNLPNSLTTIEDNAFANCEALTNIILPSSLTTIGDDAFANCEALTNIILPNSLTTIGSHAFNNCNNLQSIDIPNSINEIGEYAFANCNALTSLNFEDGINPINVGNRVIYNSPIKRMHIGREIDPKDGFSASQKNLTEVTFGENIKHIGDNAFYNCSSLKNVTLPKSIIEIGESAFEYCSALTTINFPNSLLKIGNRAFYKTGLTSVDIPDNVTEIGESVFYGCTQLNSAKLPNSLVEIPKFLFSESGISSIDLPETVTRIGVCAFANCINLTSINLPNSLIEIGAYAFDECSSLNNVVLPNSITTLGDYAFYGCSSLSSINVPKSIKSIGEGAFSGCESLNVVKIEDINEWAKVKLGNRTSNPFFYAQSFTVGDDSKRLKHLNLDLGDENVEAYTFYNANNLQTVRIKAGIIDKEAFTGCANMNNLYIDVNEVAGNAFSNNNSLSAVYCPRVTPPTALNSSFSNYTGVNLYVPAGSVNNYEDAQACWWNFSNILESDFADVDAIFDPDGQTGIRIESMDDYTDNTNPNCSNDIFSIHGVCLKRNATDDDINLLTPGLYIINGKKVLVK